jgi:hypothetical protein
MSQIHKLRSDRLPDDTRTQYAKFHGYLLDFMFRPYSTMPELILPQRVPFWISTILTEKSPPVHVLPENISPK